MLDKTPYIPTRPVHNRMIVRPLPQPEVSEGGIVIPGTVREVFEEAVVVKSSSEIIKEGEIVIYPQHLGVPKEYHNVKHKWINDSEIWGVNEPEPEINGEE